MKFNPEEYKNSRDAVQKKYKKDGLDKTLEMATVSGINLIAALFFILEIDNQPHIRDNLNNLAKFYKVEL